MSRCCAGILAALCWWWGWKATAQVTYSGTTSADTFLAAGSPGNPDGTNLADLNFGAAGVLAVAPASSLKGEFQSLLEFDMADAAALFDASFGTNGWTVTSMSLQLTSNFGTAGEPPDNPIFNVINGGQFVVEWLATNGWPEGTGRPMQPTMDGVTYDSLPSLLAGAHEILCTNLYTPPGDNVPVTYPLPLNTNLLNEIACGSDITLLCYAADDQIGYLFNSRNFGNGNQPLINVIASAWLEILSGSFTNGAFLLTGLGGASQVCQVQANSNLLTTNWQTIGTATADATGAIQFDDLTATNCSQRFYRLSR